MARLNEAPLPTESVDALKRRFIRQNRDLAKINSQQSLRIRSLECDVSRMLSENLGLREEILRLQNQLAASQPSIDISAVADVKSQLQARIEEIGNLVAGLALEQHADRPKRTVDPSKWRPSIPNLHLAGPELRMPSIAEDKFYPRRTLELEEVRSIRLSDQSTESPDLGPPPVAHFECEDPIKFAQPLPRPQETVAQLEEEEKMSAEMSVNLETRRKRKDSQSKVEVKPDQIEAVASDDASPAPVRASAKRKLGVRDIDDLPATAPKDDFRFSRRVSIGGASGRTNSVLKDTVKIQLPTAELTEQPIRERRVLGEKSKNMSPKKIDAAGKPGSKSNDKAGIDGEKEPGFTKPRTRKPRVSSVLPVPIKIEPVVESVEIPLDSVPDALPPTTPAPDLFSPTPSEPSAMKLGDDDRQGNAVKGANLEGMIRPSRRARSAVNYAEPSLNTKMRRPDKSLVAAVYSRSGGNPPSADQSTDSKQVMRTVVIKKENNEDGDSAWKAFDSVTSNEPASPSVTKAASIALNKEPTVSNPVKEVSGAQAVISAMNTGNTKPIRKTPGEQVSRASNDVADQKRDLAVYDFDETDPVNQASEIRRIARHSSMSGPMEADSPKAEDSLNSSSPADISQGRTASHTRSSSLTTKIGTTTATKVDRGSRRRSMMV